MTTRERIAGTQSSLFDELPNGQKMLFNMVPPKRIKAAPAVQSSLLESITTDIKVRELESAPLPGQSRLF